MGLNSKHQKNLNTWVILRIVKEVILTKVSSCLIHFKCSDNPKNIM